METITKEANVVMLATEDKNAPLGKCEANIHINNCMVDSQHLYFISDDEIKELP